MQLFEFLESTGGVITAFGIIVTTISSSFVFFYKIYRRTKIIYQQLMPNGGASLADTINQISRHQQIATSRLQVVWENMSMGYFESDADGNYIFANKKLCDKFGLSMNEMAGTGWLRSLTTQSERDKVRGEWQAALRNGIPYDTVYEIKNQRTNRKYKVRSQAWPCLDKKGNILWMFGTTEELEQVA